ncbi:hypothetical protein AGABI2DRAFT_119204 [Agaricus bisporus var. bisporus H97]|uniref:hypothetical protein n=1 Tax=Agaricus bisporus var. bisporus (strain H97 / ATCC MYA-4626 / FGSC 10389) TaxID=936046 RepID=UPI00029F4FE1|nr:hypothetical protein AGABI2DRAFT_119204 [Agaricus bisporus var. bisporus H97]EKV45518.1 hypothetical protein AGABI2DRAFT_119204 [Agaricus bisporus var. bisporus H97]
MSRSLQVPNTSSVPTPRGDAVNADGSLKDASEIIWEMSRRVLRALSYDVVGEAVNADGTLKDASEMTWMYDPDDNDMIPAAPADGPSHGIVSNSASSDSKRANKRKKVDVNMFLDIEAAVNVSSDESDEESDAAFIDDADREVNCAQPDIVPPMNLSDAMEADPDFIDSLMAKYVEKHSGRQEVISTPSLLAWRTWALGAIVSSTLQKRLGFVSGVHGQRNTVDVVAVPRLHYVKAAKRRKREQRPSQALFNPVKCANTFGRKSVTTVFASDGVDVVGHVFRNHQYDRAGYVVLKDLPQGHYTPVDRASRAKYILFNNCVAVSVSDLHTSMKVLENRSLRRSDKVRVLDGVFRGMVGTVEDVHLHHLSVILPNTVFDGLLEVPIESVTRSFALGDHVLVNTGERKGAQGYVVSTDNGCDTITIQSIKPEVYEIVVSAGDVQEVLHDLSFAKPRPVSKKIPNQRQTSLQRYVSSNVILQTDPFKGYSGIIQYINGDGVADIKLDTFSVTGVQTAQRHVLELYFILIDDQRMYHIESEETYDLVTTNLSVPLQNPVSSPQRPSTPTADIEEMQASGDIVWSHEEGEGS